MYFFSSINVLNINYSILRARVSSTIILIFNDMSQFSYGMFFISNQYVSIVTLEYPLAIQSYIASLIVNAFASTLVVSDISSTWHILGFLHDLLGNKHKRTLAWIALTCSIYVALDISCIWRLPYDPFIENLRLLILYRWWEIISNLKKLSL